MACEGYLGYAQGGYITMLVIGIILIVVMSWLISGKDSPNPTLDFEYWQTWIWLGLIIGVGLTVAGIILLILHNRCDSTLTTLGVTATTPIYVGPTTASLPVVV